MLLVPHAICSEHGAIVHVGTDVAREDSRSDTTRAAYHDAGSGTETDHHEHCLCDAIRRASWVGASATACQPVDGAVTNIAAIRAVQRPLSSQSILSLAPKSSPPTSRA